MKVSTPGRKYYHIGLWCNKYSSCLENGSIMDYLKSLESTKELVVPFSDGFDDTSIDGEFGDLLKNKNQILGMLCSRFDQLTIQNKILYLPLDDEMFTLGLKYVLERDIPNLYLPWEARIPKLYFRGTGPSPHRTACVKHLLGYPHSNVKFMPTIYNTPDHFEYPEMAETQTYPGVYSHHFVHAHTPLTEFVKHKYILIMDGYIIASSLQWVFGSRSVPVLLTNENNQFWFRDLLTHRHNCVLVYHLNNLKSEIEFLVNNDSIAKQIADNAFELSERIFSPSFQREYLQNKIKEYN